MYAGSILSALEDVQTAPRRSLAEQAADRLRDVLERVDDSVRARVFLNDVDRSGLRACVHPLSAVGLTTGPDEVLADLYEPASTKTAALSLMRRKERATRRKRQRGSA